MKKLKALLTLAAAAFLLGGCSCGAPASSASLPVEVESLPLGSPSSQSGFPVPKGSLTLAEYRGMQALPDLNAAFPSEEEFRAYLERAVGSAGFQPQFAPAEGFVLPWTPEDGQERYTYMLPALWEGRLTYWGADCLNGEISRWDSSVQGREPVEAPPVFSEGTSALRAVYRQFEQSLKPDGGSLRLHMDGERPYFQSGPIPIDGGTAIRCLELDQDGGSAYTIHAYELVSYPDESHTATLNWYTVYPTGFTTDLVGNLFILTENAQ